MPFRFSIFLIGSTHLVTGCASTVPSNFVYETSLRDEQGWMGAANRRASAKALLNGGIVSDPNEALASAIPDAEIKLRRWGLVYLSKNWKRYQVVLDADVTRGEEKVKCRLSSPDSLSGALTLPELRANEGADVQRRLNDLVEVCAEKVRDSANAG